MSTPPPATDSSAAVKRRKLVPFDTIRVRKGGSNSSHITPLDTNAVGNAGSDTEDEADEETAQYYLNKMSDDADRPKETVFGKDIQVWRSKDGTMHADLTDRQKQQMRERELWNQEALDKVAGGLKRKIAGEKEADVKQWMQGQMGKGDMVPVEPTPLPAAPKPPLKSAYPARDPSRTLFHHSSAGIDPLGAHNRPIIMRPLPKRQPKLPSMGGERIIGVQANPTTTPWREPVAPTPVPSFDSEASLPDTEGGSFDLFGSRS
ncbi:hypothetical protein ACEQ8H_002109 [Pleosporales sp. CAS-2024a]